MKTITSKNEQGEELTITFPDTPIEVDYELGQEVWFYLQNSLEVNHGRVVGFFLMLEDFNDDSKRTYVYQVEYNEEMKDGKIEMRLGTVTVEDSGTDEKDVKNRFEKIRKKRIDAAIRQGEIEMGGAKAEKETHAGREKELAAEIKRLKSLKR